MGVYAPYHRNGTRLPKRRMQVKTLMYLFILSLVACTVTVGAVLKSAPSWLWLVAIGLFLLSLAALYFTGMVAGWKYARKIDRGSYYMRGGK